MKSAKARTEKERAKKRAIRLPMWYRVVQFTRRTQLRMEWRSVFDVESDPILRKKPIAEKTEIANELSYPRYIAEKKKHEAKKGKDPDWRPFDDWIKLDVDDYQEAVDYIDNHHQLKEASQMVYRNIVLNRALSDRFDEIVAKTLDHADPMKALSLIRTIRQEQKEYAMMHEHKVIRKETAAEDRRQDKKGPEGLNIPGYWNKGKEAKK